MKVNQNHCEYNLKNFGRHLSYLQPFDHNCEKKKGENESKLFIKIYNNQIKETK